MLCLPVSDTVAKILHTTSRGYTEYTAPCGAEGICQMEILEETHDTENSLSAY